jgi:mono/diheme cytochrome c family protein
MLRYLFLVVILAASPALADADNGRRLALAHCATCHAVTPLARSDEVSAAPPFDEIARRFGGDVPAISLAISGPHQKMNFSPPPREANDLAAYIATLQR